MNISCLSSADSRYPLNYQLFTSHFTLSAFSLKVHPSESGGNLQRVEAHCRNDCKDYSVQVF